MHQGKVTKEAMRVQSLPCSCQFNRSAEVKRMQHTNAAGLMLHSTSAGKPMPGNVPMPAQPALLQSAAEPSAIQKFINPGADELPDELSMPIWDHLEELRERVLISALAAGLAILTCFCFSKDLVVFLEAPVITQVSCDLPNPRSLFFHILPPTPACLKLGPIQPCLNTRHSLQGVKFLALSPGEFFFTTLKVSGYAGLLVATPTILYEIISYVIPGLTKNERKFLAPIVFGSSVLFYLGLLFSYEILTPAALTFFVSYADGAVESFWSIDQYFEFVLVLMLSTGLAFQVWQHANPLL